MTPQRWNQISAIFDAVLEVEPQGRSAYLREACGGDEDLLQEIERMLAEDGRTAGFLERPVVAGAKTTAGFKSAESGAPSSEADLTGTVLQGRFRIRSKLGAGGMGEVYLADDTMLKRSLALKRLPPAMRTDDRFRSNLLREARRASSLNDPHIAHVYDLLEEGGEAFLLMEYVEGNTLRQRISSPLTVPEFFDIAIQCAGALLAAHQKGIVHCDIKPDNIMLTPSGLVKILDFGIAKRLPASEAGSTTTTSELEGLIGTPNYMAPEVLAGTAPDPRSDIYSLGVTLFEASVGRRPTASSDASARAVFDRPATLPAIERILTKMLQADPARRYSDAGELLRDLETVRESHPRTVRRIAIATAALFLAVLLSWVAVTRVRPWVYGLLHPVPGQKQVAVLPFTVAGADAGSKAFADGLSEVVSAKLSQLTGRPQFQVIPASEVRDRHVTTATDARKEFGVNLVIEGTWLQVSGSVHVMPVLIDATTNRQLRSSEFVAASSDPIGLESEVASGVLNMLEIELEPKEQASFNGQGTSESSAFAHYLRGQGYLEEFAKPENIDLAISEFSGALKQDPYYARALAGLGEAYWKKYEATRDPQWSTLSQRDCAHAVELGESESSGHACLGQVLRGTGEYQQALVQYRRALELEPTSDDAVAGLAKTYASLNKPKEAEATYRKAIALRPKYWYGYNALGAFDFNQGRYSDAAEMFAHIVSIAPDSSLGWSNLGGAYIMEGRYQQGIEALQHSISIRPDYDAYTNLATAYFDLRQFQNAATQCLRALQLDDRDYMTWGNLASAYYYGGQRGEAAKAFAKAATLAQEQLAVNPRDATVLGNLASYYSSLEQDARAEETIGRALKLAPTDPDVLEDAAMVYSDSRPDLAVRYLENALRHGLTASTILQIPAFDNLRKNGKLQSLLKRYGGTEQKGNL